MTSAAIDLSGTFPSWSGELQALWRQSLRRARLGGRRPGRCAFGFDPLRETLGELLRLPPDQLCITAGVRATALAIGRTFKRVAVECPTFTGVPAALTVVGAEVRLVSWDRTARGMDGEANGVFWGTSPGRNPDGRSFDHVFRARLSELAARGGTVVQNEVYRWYCQRPERVPTAVSVGSLAKTAGPESRIGWLSHPELTRFVSPELLLMAPPLPWQRAWDHFLRAGGLDMLVESIIRPAVRARALFVARAQHVLDRAALAAEGPSLVLTGPSWSGEPTFRALMRRGLVCGRGEDFGLTSGAARLCFLGIEPEQAIDAADRVLAVLSSAASI